LGDIFQKNMAQMAKFGPNGEIWPNLITLVFGPLKYISTGPKNEKGC
jgi:hypothetical protein